MDDTVRRRRRGARDRHRSDSSSSSSSSSPAETVVPAEMFTTMRYEAKGIVWQELLAPCPVLARKARLIIINDDQEDPLMTLPLLDRHIHRLLHSVEVMRDQYPSQWGKCKITDAQLRQALQEEIIKGDECSKGSSRRIRMSIDQTGRIVVMSFALATGSASDSSSNKRQPLTVRLDIQSINDDRASTPTHLYKIKTGYRQMYDDARLRVQATLGMSSKKNNDMAAHDDCFDVLMWQERAEDAKQTAIITESSIANVLLHIHSTDQVITSPSASLPLLNGLMRQELLSRGLISEEDLVVKRLRADVEEGKASLYLCNALRGIIPVKLVD